MKILYDHQVFSTQVHGGVSRYFTELIKKIQQYPDVSIDVSVIHSENRYFNQIFPQRSINFLLGRKLPGKYTLNYALNKFHSSRAIKKADYDLFHPTYFDPYFMKNFPSKPFVVTIYDMIHEKYPESFPQDDKTSQYKYELMMNSSRIIAISEQTKSDIMKTWDIESEKIIVIPLASSLDTHSLQDKDQNSKEYRGDYILFVGVRRGYKNFHLLLEAVAPILEESGTLTLICAGGEPVTTEERKFIRSLHIEEKIQHVNPSDEGMADYYNHACCFVFPSLYEGFGIPILEAFACRCPVACSNTSSFPEIAGDAAIYFDPKNIDSIHDTLRRVIENEDLRQNLINKGIERSEKYSWERTAQLTHELYVDTVNQFVS